MMRYAAQKDGVVRMGWIDEADDGRGGTDADEPDRKGLRRASGRGKYYRRAAKKSVMNSPRRICHLGDRGPRRTGRITLPHRTPVRLWGRTTFRMGARPRFFAPARRSGSGQRRRSCPWARASASPRQTDHPPLRINHLFALLFDMRQCLTRVRTFGIRSRGILGFVSEAQRLPKPICSASRLRG